MKKNIFKILIFSILSILIGAIIPGVIMFNFNIFSENDIIDRLDFKAKSIYDSELYYQKLIDKKKKILLDDIYLSHNKDIGQLLQSYEKLDMLSESLKYQKSVRIAPFYPNEILVLWVFLFFGLLNLIFSVKLKYSKKSIIKDLILFSGILIVFLRFNTWFRNSQLGQYGRRIYSYANYDISPVGFFVQEIQAWFSVVLIAFVFVKWINYSDYIRRKLLNTHDISIFHYQITIRKFRKIYLEWQISSFLVAVSFIFYTFYFYNMIYSEKDLRYVPHAIVVHCVWLLLWVTVSYPLFLVKNYQIHLRESIIIKSGDALINENMNETIIPISNQILTAMLSTLAFLAPLITNLLK